MHFKLFKNKEKNTKNKEKSRGRSMVEMLGVLAIIGVLSIGGIQGYTIAMRKHKANEILNTLEKYAISYYAKIQQQILNDEVIIQENGWWTKVGKDHSSLWSEVSVEYGKISGLNHLWLSAIRSTNSGDFVVFSMSVTDKQLCETLINTTGELNPGKIDLNNNNLVEQCENWGSDEKGRVIYLFYLSFLMN